VFLFAARFVPVAAERWSIGLTASDERIDAFSWAEIRRTTVFFIGGLRLTIRRYREPGSCGV
jgi:hypothetical protein